MAQAERAERQERLNRVTIVIPVYADWPTVRSCIEAVRAHADADDYDVLIVNDCGPEADELEAGILGLIDGDPQFRYVRNPENLGFVRTCNRAVLELDATANDILLLNSDTEITPGSLDELRRVLALSERHGAVCPRSNDATIASIPFLRRQSHSPRSARRAREVHDALATELPEFSIAPVAVGFCFLIRRSLVARFGLFDEIYGRGYNEENDLCMRMDAAGYASVIANRAFVLHVGSSSFGAAQRNELEARNSIVLRQRYPFYPRAVAEFIRDGYSIVDRFADLLVPAVGASRPTVLVDIRGLADSVDASGPVLRGILALLLSPEGAARYELSLVGTIEDARPILPDGSRARLVDPDAVDEVFDVGIASTTAAGMSRAAMLNSRCLHWIVVHEANGSHPSWHERSLDPTRPTARALMLAWTDRRIEVGPDGRSTSSESITSPSADFLALLDEVLALPNDLARLRDREAAIADIVRVWRPTAEAASAAQSAYRRTTDSRSYRLSVRVASAAAMVRAGAARVRRPLP